MLLSSHGVFLALALVVLALLLLRWTSPAGVERWAFTPKGGKTDFKDAHRQRILNECALGRSFEELQRTESWDYLAKYDEAAAKAICDEGTKAWRAGLAKPETLKTLKSELEKCKYGPCPEVLIRETHPCKNKKWDEKPKCCDTNHKNCKRPPRFDFGQNKGAIGVSPLLEWASTGQI
jgi:hypothetical protein